MKTKYIVHISMTFAIDHLFNIASWTF